MEGCNMTIYETNQFNGVLNFLKSKVIDLLEENEKLIIDNTNLQQRINILEEHLMRYQARQP